MKSNHTKNESTKKEYNLPNLYEQLKTKSDVIRFLHSEGVSRSDISRMLDIRYQHVRNVLITPLKTK